MSHDGKSKSNETVQRVLREAGWELGPTFWERYYSDAWIFNLVNLIERQAIALRKIETAYEESKTGNPHDRDEQYENLLDLASTVRQVFDSDQHQRDDAGRHLPDCWCAS